MIEAVVAPASRRKKRTFGCRSGARTTEWFQARTPRNQTGIQSGIMCADCMTAPAPSTAATIATVLRNLGRYVRQYFV